MTVQRTWLPLGLFALALGAAPGCHKDEPPQAQAEAASAAARNNPHNGKAKLNLRNPMSNARMDPQAMKDYRVDVCEYGTFALEQARDAYFVSLGKDEPSEKKIPSFGIGNAAAPAAPGGSASAGAKNAAPPKAPPKASAAASASAAPAGSVAMPHNAEHHFDFARAPYERNARACSAAAALKEPAMAPVDEALKDYAPLAVELAKDIVAANNYYSKEEYKKDGFEKGKTLHKKMVEEFGKLDDLHDKLGKALTGWRKEHPADTSKWESGQKLADATVEDGKTLVLAMAAAKKPDVEAYKAASAKLTTDAEALKTQATSTPADPWGKILVTPVDVFARAVKEGEAKVAERDAETFLTVVNGFVGLIEARQRALSHAMRPQIPGVNPSLLAPQPIPAKPVAKPE